MKLVNVYSDFSLITECLSVGGIICFPTETVYSLSCDATIPSAVQRIYEIKKRSLNKPLPILMRDVEQIEEYALLDHKALRLVRHFSPGPITYLVPAKKKISISPNVIAKGNIGVRIPDHRVALYVLKNYANPLIGTSVNISGEISAKNFDEIPQEILDVVDVVIKDDKVRAMSGVSSTVIDLSIKGQCKIVREGEVKKSAIEKKFKGR